MSKADNKFKALREQGFTGATPDMIKQWLISMGGLAGTVSDLWKEVLQGLGFTGAVADMQFAWLGSLGHTQGTLADRWASYWANPTPFGAKSHYRLSTNVGNGTYTRAGRMSSYRDGQVYLYAANEPAFDDNGLVMAGADEQYLTNPADASGFTVTTDGEIVTGYGITPWGTVETNLLRPGDAQASGQVRIQETVAETDISDGVKYFEFFVRGKGHKYPFAILSVTNKDADNRRIWFDLKKGIVGSKEGDAVSGVKGSMTRFVSEDYELDAWFGQAPEWWLVRMEVDLGTGTDGPICFLQLGDRDGELGLLDYDDSGAHGIEYCGANLRDSRGTFMDYTGVRGAAKFSIPAPYTQLNEGGFMVTVAPPVHWGYGDTQPSTTIAPIISVDADDRSGLLTYQASTPRFGSWQIGSDVFANAELGGQFNDPFKLALRFSTTDLGVTTGLSGSEKGSQIIMDGVHKSANSNFQSYVNDGTLYLGSCETADVFEMFTIADFLYWDAAPSEADMLAWSQIGQRFFVDDNGTTGDGSISDPWSYAELDNGTIWNATVTGATGAKSVIFAPTETEVTVGYNTGYAAPVAIRTEGAADGQLTLNFGTRYKPALLDQSGTAAGSQLNKTLYTLGGRDYITVNYPNVGGAYAAAADGAQIRFEETGVGNQLHWARAAGDPLQNDVVTPANTTNAFQGMYINAQKDFIGRNNIAFDQAVKGMVIVSGSTPADHQNIDFSHFYVEGVHRYAVQAGGSNGDYHAPFIDVHHFAVYHCGMIGESEATDGLLVHDFTAFDISNTTQDPVGLTVPTYGWEFRGSRGDGVEIYDFQVQDLYKESGAVESAAAWFNVNGTSTNIDLVEHISVYRGQMLQTVGTKVAGFRAVSPDPVAGQDFIYMDDCLLVCDTVSATSQRGAYLDECQTEGAVRNCTFIGYYESVRFASDGKANWTLATNLFGGTAKCVTEANASSAASLALSGNYYWRDGVASTNLVTLEGTTYTDANVSTVDANAITGGTPAYVDVVGPHLTDRDYNQTAGSPALGVGYSD